MVENENSDYESSELTSSREDQKLLPNINKEFEKIVDLFLKKNEDIQEISLIFEKWIYDFINSELFIYAEKDFKLYDLFETFNQTIIKRIPKKKPKAGTKSDTFKKHVELSSDFFDQLTKKAIQNFSIFKFLDSDEWNSLLFKYLNAGDIDPMCIISLKKTIMFINLMRIKIQKYNLNKGW